MSKYSHQYRQQAEILRYLPNCKYVEAWPDLSKVYECPGATVLTEECNVDIGFPLAIEAYKMDSGHENARQSVHKYLRVIVFETEGPVVLAKYVDESTLIEYEEDKPTEDRHERILYVPSLFPPEVNDHDAFLFIWTRKQFLKDFG